MTTATKVYLTRLAGLPVIDPSGEAVGRLRDAIAMLRPQRQPPRVLGLIVEMQHRRRIFVPAGRITGINVEAIVLSTGMVNLKRFEQRAGERLVLGELLDSHVTLLEDSSEATIVDLAMEQNRALDWELTRAAIRLRASGRLTRRRGQLKQVDWDEISGLSLVEEDQGAEHLIALFAEMHVADVAASLRDTPSKRRHEVARAMDDERLADVLEELPNDQQLDILRTLPDERAADVLEAMNPDDAADLLAELAEQEKDRLLELMEPEDAAPVRRLMTYANDTAGGLMTSDPVVLSPDASIAEALARVRNPDLPPAVAAQVFVCRPPTETPTGRYLGVAHIQRLLREAPSELVGAAIDDDLEPLRPDAPLAAMTRMLATYNLVAAPVVDEAHRLVGAVTVDDVLDALLPDDWRED